MSEGLLILIVEDNEVTATSLAQVFRWEGYRVQTAPNGEQALALLKSGERPAIILLDLMMPVMNGWELCRHLQADPDLASVPLVVLTGTDDGQHQGELLGASAVFTKPFDLDRLSKAVATHATRAGGRSQTSRGNGGSGASSPA
ncbi:MAG: Sensory box histidine kinase/response regulator [Armatimonadetes bacterium]|jgi:CheY-like chemotaxis protein|nr:Sensory box histidine kinase/response regulator [Armatimonadota bacterium]